MSRVGEGLRDASRKTYREIYICVYVRNYLESIKFVYYNINLYSRTRTYILDRAKVFCIIVGNLLKICIYLNKEKKTLTKNKKR